MVNYVYDAWGDCQAKFLSYVDGGILYKNVTQYVESSDKNCLQYYNIAKLNPFRYRGYYYDTETGLYYLQTRYYDPEVGRFISQDSIEYADPEAINGLNLYAYCLNNPVMNVDPTGTIVFTTLMIIGLIVGAVIGATVGGVVAGTIAYDNGARGWELFGWTLLGVVGGGIIGGAIGAFIGWAAPAIGSFLGSSFTLGQFALATGETVAISVTGGQAIAGALGLLIMFASNERPRNNSKQNEQIRAGVRELGFNPKKPEVLDIINDVEEYIHKNGLNLGYRGIVELLKDFLL